MSAPTVGTAFGPPELGLALPRNSKGLGALIGQPDSPQLIDGVRVRPAALWPDDRGYFMEITRGGQGLVADYAPETTQVSMALSYPGAIKAFHWHAHQTDCWHPVAGLFQVALVDLRSGSPTFGTRNTLYLGALRPWQVLIPPGVGHGYKIVSQEPGILVYVTNRLYNPADEGRIPYDDPAIHYDWETQHK